MELRVSPCGADVSDRIGRRPMLLMSLLGSVVFYALFGFAATLTAEQPTLAIGLMLVSRIGAGIAGASVSTAAAVIADCTPPENRSKGMALIGAAFGIGFTFGPLIALRRAGTCSTSAVGCRGARVAGCRWSRSCSPRDASRKRSPGPNRRGGFFSLRADAARCCGCRPSARWC